MLEEDDLLRLLGGRGELGGARDRAMVSCGVGGVVIDDDVELKWDKWCSALSDASAMYCNKEEDRRRRPPACTIGAESVIFA